MGDVESLVAMARQLAKDGNSQAESAMELAKQLKEQWHVLHALTQRRITLARTYVTFHKRAQEVGHISLKYAAYIIRLYIPVPFTHFHLCILKTSIGDMVCA